MKPWLVFVCLGCLPMTLRALDPGAGYDPAVHDVFSSGYPAAPLRNADPAFLGAGRSLASVGWASASPTKSFGFLTPEHYLVARHFGGTASITVFGADGAAHVRDQWKTENLDLGVVFQGNTTGDLSVGTLLSPFPLSAMPSRLGMLDLHGSSSGNSPAAYEGIPLHAYGRGPDGSSSTCLGAETVSNVVINGNQHQLEFPRDSVKLQGGDSGSPSLAPWINPNGDPEYGLLGNHAAVNLEAGINFDNFAASREVMQALNARLTDEGRTLRMVGNPVLEWAGVQRNTIGDRRSWKSAFPTPVPDVYALYRGDTAGNGRVVDVSADFNHRGLYFADTGGGLGFRFDGTSTLEIGRGGITNYDASLQTFDAPLRLTNHQYWDAGRGGVAVRTLDTGGFLLEIGGAGGADLNGMVIGSGSLAFDGGTSTFTGAATYTGDTWIHEAALRVDGDLRSSRVVRIAAAGTLAGSGAVSELANAGVVSPGAVDGILTATVLTDTGGGRLRFTVTSTGAPAFGAPAAAVNDVLRLTDVTPFSRPMVGTSRVEFYLDTADPPVEGDVYLAGIFTDAAEDFGPDITPADLRVYLSDAGGAISFEGQTYSLYTGEGDWHLDTVAQSADFGAGAVSGRITRLRRLPPEGTYGNWTYFAFPEETPPGDKALDAAPNTAGVQNRYAYVYGLNPLDPVPEKLPRSQASAGILELFFRRRTLISDFDYVVESTGNLTGTWVEEAPTPVVVDADPDGGGEVELVKVTIPLGAEERLKFLRLRHPALP